MPAGGRTMSKRMIPRVAFATLVLGGACGDDGDGDGNSKKSLEPAGVDASQPRADDVTEAACKQYNQCDPDAFADEYASISACQKGLNGELDDVAQGDKTCK